MDFLRHQMLSRQVCMDGHKYTFFLTQLHQNTTIIITFVLLNGILKNITSQRVVHDVNNSEYQYHCAFTFAFKAELYVRANATKTE